jgi:hypothetical protein
VRVRVRGEGVRVRVEGERVMARVLTLTLTHYPRPIRIMLSYGVNNIEEYLTGIAMNLKIGP